MRQQHHPLWEPRVPTHPKLRPERICGIRRRANSRAPSDPTKREPVLRCAPLASPRCTPDDSGSFRSAAPLWAWNGTIPLSAASGEDSSRSGRGALERALGECRWMVRASPVKPHGCLVASGVHHVKKKPGRTNPPRPAVLPLSRRSGRIPALPYLPAQALAAPVTRATALPAPAIALPGSSSSTPTSIPVEFAERVLVPRGSRATPRAFRFAP